MDGRNLEFSLLFIRTMINLIMQRQMFITCYTCSRYITTPEYLEAHKQHLANLEKQLEEGAIYGEHYAEHFIPTIEVLKFIIERLEGLQNGN